MANKKEKTNDLFATITSITQKKSIPGGYSKKEANAYILLLWLSQSSGILSIINKINQYQYKLPDELVYKYLFQTIPKGFRKIYWTKGKQLTEKQKTDIKEMSDLYGISEKEARLSLDI